MIPPPPTGRGLELPAVLQPFAVDGISRGIIQLLLVIAGRISLPA